MRLFLTLGEYEDAKKIIDEYQVDEVIIAIENNERADLKRYYKHLAEKEVNVKMMPDKVDILSGSVRTNNVMGTPLIEIHPGLMNPWQQNIKRLIDVFLSLSALIIFSPLILYSCHQNKIFIQRKNIFFAGKNWP